MCLILNGMRSGNCLPLIFLLAAQHWLQTGVSTAGLAGTSSQCKQHTPAWPSACTPYAQEGGYRSGMLCIGKIVWENPYGTCWHPTGTFQYLTPSRALHKRGKFLILRFTVQGWADCCAHMVPH